MAAGLTTCDMCGAKEHPRRFGGKTFTHSYYYKHWDFCPKCEPKGDDFVERWYERARRSKETLFGFLL